MQSAKCKVQYAICGYARRKHTLVYISVHKLCALSENNTRSPLYARRNAKLAVMTNIENSCFSHAQDKFMWRRQFICRGRYSPVPDLDPGLESHRSHIYNIIGHEWKNSKSEALCNSRSLPHPDCLTSGSLSFFISNPVHNDPHYPTSGSLSFFISNPINHNPHYPTSRQRQQRRQHLTYLIPCTHHSLHLLSTHNTYSSTAYIVPSPTITNHHLPSPTITYHHLPSPTITYHHLPSPTLTYHHLLSQTLHPGYLLQLPIVVQQHNHTLTYRRYYS